MELCRGKKPWLRAHRKHKEEMAGRVEEQGRASPGRRGVRGAVTLSWPEGADIIADRYRDQGRLGADAMGRSRMAERVARDL